MRKGGLLARGIFHSSFFCIYVFFPLTFFYVAISPTGLAEMLVYITPMLKNLRLADIP